ncbi:deoxyhypusine synthase family protein [Candidatus Methylacidiphilum infernorum]|uniref:deoxyhypusine synthase family protein n=1 Tax=Candidatus Methylacidiphilum infernorum TaxID=511746 RepID=UPI001F5D1F06|nr:deoxyhypusine synthase family protein [Candidatus Methylacidiphilum infernorum]
MKPQPIKQFIDHHFRHFNAAALKEAAKGYVKHLESGGKMMVALGGAMSTAELGISLAEMIRQDKVHAISCTGANLEEDIFNLVAHDYYKRIPHYRELSVDEEVALYENHLNRVTDTCIPEEEAMRRIERAILKEWIEADQKKQRFFPHEFLWKVLQSGKLEPFYQIDPKDSWVLAALEKKVFIVVPGWEDSTLGNIFAAHCLLGHIHDPLTVKTGIEYMMALAQYYQETTKKHSLGLFQIGGGISGDFPICVVPMLHQDMQLENIPLWGYFCQISDATTSYGSYSGASPNEKITWGKLAKETPKFMIESDATIVAPLIFAYVLES